LALFTLIGLVAIWEIVARYAGFDELLIASPGDVLASLRDDRALLAEATFVTAQEALLGLALAIAFGLTSAVALHLTPALRDALYPLLIGSQSIPIVVIAPLLVLLLGFGLAPKVLIVALACFFPVTVATVDGLRAADPDLLRLMRSLGAPRLRTLRLIELPGAMPRFAGGVRVAVTWAFVSAVFAEYAGTDAGLGYLIARGTPTFETGRVYACVLILVAGSLALWALTATLERRLLPWATHDQKPQAGA
jgi:NitT/TauT family transport system permease protein/putative hydroxymethylpyrimidine transport system permease protein